jgi:hypothetical protein
LLRRFFWLCLELDLMLPRPVIRKEAARLKDALPFS